MDTNQQMLGRGVNGKSRNTWGQITHTHTILRPDVKAILKLTDGKNQSVETNIGEKSNYKGNIGAGYAQV